MMLELFGIANLWFLASAIFIVLEVVMGMTVVLLFASLSAFTLGSLIYFGYVSAENAVMQLSFFFGFTIFWSLALYKPLKTIFFHNKLATNYQNIVGSNAEVIVSNLEKGKIGSVKWSGSTFKAALADNAEIEKIEIGTIVRIVEVRENIFIVNK